MNSFTMTWIYTIGTILLILVPATEGITKSACPVACYCDKQTTDIAVKCKAGYWNEIPLIPTNTSKLHIYKGNFGVLRRPEACSVFQTLEHLFLRENNITSINADAFHCMQQIITLTLSRNLVKVIEPGTFSGMTKLFILEVSRNKLTGDVFKEISMLENLSNLMISENGMTISASDLQILGKCTKLSLLDISGNVINGTLENVIRPIYKVSELTADNCGITSLRQETFLGFSNLNQLSLSNNILHYVSPKSLYNLTNLANLILTNSLEHVQDRNWLNHSPSLHTVILHGNNLRSIPAMQTVISLFANENRFESIDSHFFSGIPNVKTLSISHSHVKYIDGQAFQDIPYLTHLTATDNGILPASFINMSASLANSSIQFVDLSGNYLKILQRNIFRFFMPNKLSTLKMSGCKIETVKPYIFENFGYLTLLDLSLNSISSLPKFVFNGLHSLKVLNLNNNKLDRFISMSYQLLNLQKLMLQHNLITDLGGKLLGPNLTQISLWSNSLGKLPWRLFENTPKLAVLNLQKNKISNIENGTFTYLKNLHILVLDKNQIPVKTLPYSGLSDLKKLATIRFKSNPGLGKDPLVIKSMLTSLSDLELIDLSLCSLRSLPQNMFCSNKKLENLVLRSNEISYLEPTAFCNATKLHTLILTGNSIRFVSFENFVNLPGLRELQLSRNPLLCNCQVLFILQAVKMHLLYMGRLDSMQCTSPSDVRGVRLDHLQMDVQQCENKWTEMLIPTASACSSVIAALILFVVRKYRWHLKYMWFLARAGRRRFYEQHQDREYHYDAFIAYSERDLPWVKDELLPNLEGDYNGQPGLHVCLHHRDWLVGVDIVDNIVNSIEQSRRTIIVLSDHFAASQWCQYELAMAQLRLDADGTSRELLAVILLSDIAPENLTPRLRFILTTKTYLPWTEKLNKQSIFWKTLRQSLSRPQ